MKPQVEKALKTQRDLSRRKRRGQQAIEREAVHNAETRVLQSGTIKPAVNKTGNKP